MRTETTLAAAHQAYKIRLLLNALGRLQQRGTYVCLFLFPAVSSRIILQNVVRAGPAVFSKSTWFVYAGGLVRVFFELPGLLAPGARRYDQADCALFAAISMESS